MAKKEQFIFEAPKKEKHKSSKKTAILSLLLVTFLTLLSLLLSLYSAGEGDIQKGFEIIGNALANGDPLWLLVIAGLMFLSYSIEALIIFVFCRLYTRKYYFHQGLANAMIGAFYNNVTPGASGGQVMQVYTMKKQGIEVSNAASIMVMWFILYQTALIIFDVFALILEWNDIWSIKSFKIENFSIFGWDGTITMLPLIIIGFAVNVGVIMMLFLMSYSHRFHNFIMHYGIGFLAKIKIIKKPDKTRENLRIQVENFKIELRRLQANIPVTVLIVFLFLCILAIRFSIPYFSGLALNSYGANEGFRFDRLNDACFRSAFHQMVSGLVPLPGGAGISEIVYNAMFNGFFVETYAVTETGLSVIRTPSANVMSTQILWRIATFYFVLIASGTVAAFYHSRGQGEQMPYASRQTFVDLQLQTYDQRKLSSETLYETRQLSRKNIRKTMNANSLNDYGLVTGDDYIGPYELYKDSSKKKSKKAVPLPSDED